MLWIPSHSTAWTTWLRRCFSYRNVTESWSDRQGDRGHVRMQYFAPHIKCQRHCQLPRYCCLVRLQSVTFFFIWWLKDLLSCQTVNTTRPTHTRSAPLDFYSNGCRLTSAVALILQHLWWRRSVTTLSELSASKTQRLRGWVLLHWKNSVNGALHFQTLGFQMFWLSTGSYSDN